MSDFRRLHLAVFTGEESHLDAEQWIIDTENLLVAARVLEADRGGFSENSAIESGTYMVACIGELFVEARLFEDIFRGISG